MDHMSSAGWTFWYQGEQLGQHVHRLIGNVRKGGNLGGHLGNLILMTIEVYQIHLGTEQPFLSQDPELFPHRQLRATSCITYIWDKAISKYQQLGAHPKQTTEMKQ